ncbi:glycoside hydrolase family 3 protein, partial [Calocera viscosa TUFC12733]
IGGDPYLSGWATYQTVSGMQAAGVIATVKHYIGNEQEHYRGGGGAYQVYSSNIDDRTMHEVYAWPFAEAVRAGSVLRIYLFSLINQTQACQNSKTLNGILKEELDFQGFIMSDWTAIISGANSVLAGTDMNMPGLMSYSDPEEHDPDTAVYSYWGSNLIEMVYNGSVPETRVDDMVTRIMAAYYQMGQDKNYPAVNFDKSTENTFLDGVEVNMHVNVMGNHGQTIREIGAASTIVLKNTGVLPVDVTKYKHYGIFGSDAGPNPDGPNGCSGRGCDQGTLVMGWGSGTANVRIHVMRWHSGHYTPLSVASESKRPLEWEDWIELDNRFGEWHAIKAARANNAILGPAFLEGAAAGTRLRHIVMTTMHSLVPKR